MKKLVDMVKISENNRECVVLEVTGSMMDLIKLGCFNGDEKYIRLTKGGNHTCTIWTSDGKHYSWWWGIGGCTIVSEQTSKKGRLIKECIMEDLEICIEGDIDKTLYIQSVDDIAHITHEIKLMYWENRLNEIVCHRDGTYYKAFNSIEEGIEHFQQHGYSVSHEGSYVAGTGCVVREYKIER